MHCTKNENEKPITKWLCCLHTLCWLLTRRTASVRWIVDATYACDSIIYHLMRLTYTLILLLFGTIFFFAYARWVKGIYLDFNGLLNAQSRLRIINRLLCGSDSSDSNGKCVYKMDLLEAMKRSHARKLCCFGRQDNNYGINFATRDRFVQRTMNLMCGIYSLEDLLAISRVRWTARLWIVIRCNGINEPSRFTYGVFDAFVYGCKRRTRQSVKIK